MKKENLIVVALEGIDGAGKTTLINYIQQNLEEKTSIYERTKKNSLTDRLVSLKLFQKHYRLQIPIYFLLSYKNYIRFRRKAPAKIIIMDRCFLSSICYFFPNALNNPNKLKAILFFEVKLFPQKIFVLDVNPALGKERDNNKKNIEWLIETRNAYNIASTSLILNISKVEIIDENLTIDEKCNIILSYIKEKQNGD